jgi:hypothetical protein
MAEAERPAAICYLIGLRASNKDVHSMQCLIELFLSDPFATSAFPEFAKLATIALVLPVTTADCERGYSRMNLIKTILRNRLGELRMLDAMRASIYSIAPKDVDWPAVLKLWLQARKRALTISSSVLAK